MDNDYNFYQHAPRDYSLCFKTDCATAGTCLRALAARDLTTDAPNITIINPLLADTAGGTSCAYFRKAEQVRVAYGFKKALAQIPAGKVRAVRLEVCGLVCRRNYYYLLRGEKPIFPAMQKTIAAILQQNGLPAPVEFDRYEWHYEW